MGSRAATYSRLSVQRTGESLAIERQQEDCNALVAANGWERVYEFSDDGKSAWHEGGKRPGYEALCEAIRSGGVDIVVVYEVDRLARRLRGLLDLMDLLKTYGVTVHTVKSGIMRLDSPKDIAFAQMAGVMAESYVSDARDKNLRARRQMAEQGKRHFTSRPYGWEDDGMKLRESEASIVREITERLIDGQTGTRVARDLNARGIPTVRGALWTAIGIKKTALRAANAGIREHHGALYDGTWEPIVSREQWERVTHVLAAPSTTYRRGTGRTYPFTGFVVCGSCGRVLSVGMGRSNRKEAAYRCDQRRSNESVVTGCGGVVRAQVPVDYLIKEGIIARLDGESFRKAVAALESDEQTLSDLIAKASTQRARLDEFVEDYASGVLTKAQFVKAKTVAEANLREIERETSKHGMPRTVKGLDFSKSVRETVETADVYWLRDAAEVLIEKVTIFPLPKSGWKRETLVVDGRAHQFSADYVSITWRV